MANETITLDDVTSFIPKLEKAEATLQTLVNDLAPIEAELPLPSSVKTGFDDLQKFLAVAQGLLSHV